MWLRQLGWKPSRGFARCGSDSHTFRLAHTDKALAGYPIRVGSEW